MNYLKKMVVSVSMNKDEPWTIEPWHIRVSLRKMNVHVLSDNAIELPKQPISGPDLTLEGKSFVVYITVCCDYYLILLNVINCTKRKYYIFFFLFYR